MSKNIILRLLQNADCDVPGARGIIYIDGDRPIVRKDENPSITAHVSERASAGL